MTNMTTTYDFGDPSPRRIHLFVTYIPMIQPKNYLKTISKSLEKGKPSPLMTVEDFWGLFAVVSHFFPSNLRLSTTLAGLLGGLRWRPWLRRLTLRTRQDGGLPHAAGATCRLGGPKLYVSTFYGHKYENIPIWRTMMCLLFLFY